MKNYKGIAMGLGIAVTTLFTLSACDKTSKTSSAGGGSSTQSVMTIRGSAQ